MKVPSFFRLSFLAFFIFPALAVAEIVSVPPGINHEPWNQLLKKYVDEEGLVAYAEWKSNSADLKSLTDYLAQFSSEAGPPAAGGEAAAALINLYNALTIDTILAAYPTNSIQSLSKPFATKRLRVAGKMVSLDEIEHDTLRPAIGYRAHAVLVCAARSCPPLQTSAYQADELELQIDHAYQVWLARPDLNRFLPTENKVEISSIFSWFQGDFVKAGGIRKILGKYGPPPQRSFLEGSDYEITFLPYNWGLNDQGGQGENYSRLRLLWDRVLDVFSFWN